MKYHTAIGNKLNEQFEEIERFENEKIIAFAHDVTSKDIPVEYLNCDVLYTEIAWRLGIEKFNQRARIKNTFEEYCKGVVKFILTLEKPTVIIAGVNDRRWLPNTQYYFTTYLNKGKCVAYIYNFNIKSEHRTTEEILEELSNTFDYLGDFCCGYGNSSIPFIKKGKKAVMSDYNKSCIGYIKQTNENL